MIHFALLWPQRWFFLQRWLELFVDFNPFPCGTGCSCRLGYFHFPLLNFNSLPVPHHLLHVVDPCIVKLQLVAEVFDCHGDPVAVSQLHRLVEPRFKGELLRLKQINGKLKVANRLLELSLLLACGLVALSF